ncbi:MAG: hypothetical protein M5U32_02410 [Myxococcota bacterium]|nr:hypothetical protein [Myxococcota bacterium]
MTEADQQLRRLRAKEAIRGDFEHSLEQRVDRYLEVQHQGIVPNHHFASASSECLNLYRDGYFLSTVMVSQSVAEGIFRFVLERNSTSADRERPEMVKLLVERAIISESCGDAFVPDLAKLPERRTPHEPEGGAGALQRAGAAQHP